MHTVNEGVPMDAVPDGQKNPPKLATATVSPTKGRLAQALRKAMDLEPDDMESFQRKHSSSIAKSVKSTTRPQRPPSIATEQYDSYGFAREDSRVHFEYRARETPRQKLLTLAGIEVGIVISGVLCGLIAAAMNLTSVRIYRGINSLVERAMWSDAAPQRGLAYAAYLLTNAGLILVAALLTCWAPHAALSGLPKIKSFLNGTDIRGGLLTWRTLVAKLAGITLVVATGLPLGKEGPMVHIGAMVASLTTSLPKLRDLPNISLPGPQREWAGMGAAAGVAAAFNAPFGGILYSFEEVCSHWSSVLTWRSFVCAVVVSLTYGLIVELMDGEASAARHEPTTPPSKAARAPPSCPHSGLASSHQLAAGFAIWHDGDATYPLWEGGYMGWVVLLGIVGGLLGGVYNVIVVRLKRLRQARTPLKYFLRKRAPLARAAPHVTCTASMHDRIGAWARHSTPLLSCPPHACTARCWARHPAPLTPALPAAGHAILPPSRRHCPLLGTSSYPPHACTARCYHLHSIARLATLAEAPPKAPRDDGTRGSRRLRPRLHHLLLGALRVRV